MAIDVIVCGAAGRMGKLLVSLVHEHPEARIVGAIEAANDAMVPRTPERDATAVLPRVLAAIARSVETLPAASIGRDTVLLGEGVGVDSLDVLRIVSEIEAEFDLTLD